MPRDPAEPGQKSSAAATRLTSRPPLVAPNVTQQRDQGGGCDARYPRRGTKRRRARAVQFLADLDRQASDAVIVHIGRQQQGFITAERVDIGLLAREISVVEGFQSRSVRPPRGPTDRVVARSGLVAPDRRRGRREAVPRSAVRHLGRPIIRDDGAASGSPQASRRARGASCMAARLASNCRARTAATQPNHWPSGVKRWSALSARNWRRYSARDVNIRYGSLVPNVTKSSIMTPI